MEGEMGEQIGVLLAIDEPEFVDFASSVLRDAGFAVVETGGGSDCLQAAREHRPRVILIDADLAASPGHQMCAQLKDDPLLRSSKIVLVLADGHHAGRAAAGLNAGADGYFARPIGDRDLLASVRSFARNSQTEAELRRAESERSITAELLSRASSVRSLDELLRGLTSLLQRWSGCTAVGVRLKEKDDYPYYETRGFTSEFVRKESSLCAVDREGRVVRDADGRPVLECMCGSVLRGRTDPKLPFFTERGSFWSNATSEMLATTTDADRQTRTRNRCNGEGYESVALVPLRASGETFGLLQFNDRRTRAFSAAQVQQFERLGYGIAMAVAQQKAVEALRQSEESLRSERRSLAEAQRIAHLGSWDWNIATNELWWSDEVYRIFGLRPQEFDATYEAFMASVHPADRALVDGSVERAFRDPQAKYEVEHRVVRRDGVERIVHERGRVTFDDSAQAVRMVGTVQDVTEQKRAEEKLRAT
jgi:PAS domain S-box-containing protein